MTKKRMFKTLGLSCLASGLVLVSGCVTTSQSKSEYQAKISGLEAEKAALQNELKTYEIVNGAIERMIEIYGWAEGRRLHKPASQ